MFTINKFRNSCCGHIMMTYGNKEEKSYTWLTR